MNNINNISVCLTPEQFHNYENKNAIVVVIDLLRATSVISTAFENGIKKIIPVTSINEALKYKDKENHILAAERNTKPVSGFDFGNSPYNYINNDVNNKILVLTTTNGTKAIHTAKGHDIITASYINIEAITNYLINKQRDIIILCSGWKNLINIEDTLFAGHLSKLLIEKKIFQSNCDSLFIAKKLFETKNTDMFSFLSNSAYRKRNQNKDFLNDTKFCLNPNITSNIIPIYSSGELIAFKK